MRLLAYLIALIGLIEAEEELIGVLFEKEQKKEQQHTDLGYFLPVDTPVDSGFSSQTEGPFTSLEFHGDLHNFSLLHQTPLGSLTHQRMAIYRGSVVIVNS